MSIDAINTDLNISNAAKNLFTDDEDRRQQLAALAASNRTKVAEENASFVTVSDELAAERRDDDARSLHEATDAANATATADASRRDAAAANLARLNELATQAASDGLSDSERQSIQTEADSIKAELRRIADADDAAATQKVIDRATASAADKTAAAVPEAAISSEAALAQPGVSVFA